MNDTAPTVSLTQVHDYQFELDFGGTVPKLLADEPEPLGNGEGPSPIQLLASSVGSCLSASLLFALRKFKQQPGPMGCRVEAELGRNAEGRLRVLSMTVRMTIGVPAHTLQHLDRVLGSFENYCTVTQSLVPAIAVHLAVFDSDGICLK